ncbi:MAG: periplasmic heavy metal sensor [Paracoccaceae bacterium]
MSDPKHPNTPAQKDAQSNAPKAKPNPGNFHWSRVVLALSLGLNLAVVGLVAGAFMGKDRNGPPRGYSSRDVGYAPFIAALDRDERRALGGELRRAAPSRAQARSARRASFERILEALRATPYDPAALEAAIAAHREDLANSQKLGQETLVSRLHAMSALERIAYADRLDQILTRPAREKRSDSHRNGPPEGLRRDLPLHRD